MLVIHLFRLIKRKKERNVSSIVIDFQSPWILTVVSACILLSNIMKKKLPWVNYNSNVIKLQVNLTVSVMSLWTVKFICILKRFLPALHIFVCV